MAGSKVGVTAELVDKVSGPLAKVRDNFDRLGKSAGFKSVAQGVGLGIGVSAWGLLDKAMSSVVGFATDSVRAFADEEQSIAKLNASLSANVKGWDGNTDAIERVLTARMDLGFSDDEQRDSLALLTAATGDATKALEIQRTAMDLARLKGISLASASDALVRVEAGQFKALKGLGIELKKGATQTEALAAVQKVATGQADAYAETLSGKALNAQIKFNKAQEKFGKVIAPAVSDGLTLFSGAIDGVVVLSEKEAEAGVDFGQVIANVFTPSLTLGRQALDAAKEAVAELNYELDRERGRGAAAAIREVGDAADYTDDQLKDMTDAVKDAGDALVDRLWGPTERRGNMAGAKLDIAEAQNKLKEAEKDFAKDPKFAWTKKLKIKELKGKVGKAKGKLVELSTAAVLAGDAPAKTKLEDMLKRIEKSSDRADDEVNQLRRDINLLNSALGKGPVSSAIVGYHFGKAEGGPVSGGQSYIVGEKGPELFTPSTSGTITPNGGWGGGGATVVHTHINLDGRQIAEVVDKHQAYAMRTAPKL